MMVTGHSLGGALAVFAATDLIKAGLSTNLRLYTFGQPRTGNDAWAEQIMQLIGSSNSYFRIVHNLDPVSHIP